MLSGWFSSSSGLFHTRLYCCMCVSHTCGFLGACVCVYIYWSNGRIYMCMCIYYKYIHTESSCVWIDVSRGVHMCLDIYLFIYTQGLHVYIYVYAHRVHMCGYIYLRIYTQGLYVYVCILRIYTQSSHVRVYIIANIHIEFTYTCVYFDVYSHRVYMCVCICFRICTQSCTQNLHVYVYILTYIHREIHRESTRGCVKISYTQGSHVCVYLFAFMGTEFKHTCGCVCIYV